MCSILSDTYLLVVNHCLHPCFPSNHKAASLFAARPEKEKEEVTDVEMTDAAADNRATEPMQENQENVSI